MLIGPLCGLVAARVAIQSPSCQVYAVDVTTEAVAGGFSAALAMGSALARREPSEPRISNL
jgi:hypothetical protein